MSYTSTPLNRLVLKRVRRELANDSMLSNTYMVRCLLCSPLVPFLDVGGGVSVPPLLCVPPRGSTLTNSSQSTGVWLLL